MQIVEGAIVTCTATPTSAGLTGCQGIKLNGLSINGVPGFDANGNAVCNVITGGHWAAIFFDPVTAGPQFTWNGTNWTLASAAAQPITDLYCFVATSSAAMRVSTKRSNGHLAEVRKQRVR